MMVVVGVVIMMIRIAVMLGWRWCDGDGYKAGDDDDDGDDVMMKGKEVGEEKKPVLSTYPTED